MEHLHYLKETMGSTKETLYVTIECIEYIECSMMGRAWTKSCTILVLYSHKDVSGNYSATYLLARDAICTNARLLPVGKKTRPTG